MLANMLVRQDHAVTLISASLQHLFQPALLYVAFRNAKPDAVRDERDLLDRRVRFVHDTVTHVDLSRQVVTTSGGQCLEYDRVVIATGITTDPGQVPGLADIVERVGDYHSDLDHPRRLWSSLQGFGGGTLVLGQSSPICKCPPSPVEGILLADELLRRRGIRDKARLVFFTPYPRPYPAEAINEIVEPVLHERGIEVLTVFDVDRVDPERRTIRSIEGDELHYDLPIVIPPFVGAEVHFDPPEVLGPDRLVETDRHTLRIAGCDNAFAIGDAANLPTSKSGVGAHLEAQVVADALRGAPASFSGRTHCPLDLGRGRGTFVTGTYDVPTVRARPTRTKHLLKMLFGHVYWFSLRGRLNPLFDLYFRLTDPARAHRGKRRRAGG